MPHDIRKEDDTELAALIKSLDDAHDDLIANGPVSAEQFDRDIEAVYERHRQDVERGAVLISIHLA